MKKVLLWGHLSLVCIVWIWMGIFSTYGNSTEVWNWDLDESTGSIIYDNAGNNNGDLKNGVQRLTNGRLWNALSFDGLNDYVSLYQNYGSISNTFTLSVWVKPDNLGEVSPVLWSIFWVANKYPRLYVSDENRVGFQTEAGVGVNSPKNTLFANEWSHIAISYDGNELKLYINGALQWSRSISSIPVGNKKFFLGHDGSNFYSGRIDEIRIFNSALSSQEIYNLYDLSDPEIPTNILSSKNSQSEITLVWNPSQDDTGIKKYIIYRDGIEIAQTPYTQYIDYNLTPGQSYSYTIQAVDNADKLSPLSTPIIQSTRQGKTESYSYTYSIWDRIVLQEAHAIYTHVHPQDITRKSIQTLLPGAHGTVIAGGTNAAGKYLWLIEFDEGYRWWIEENFIAIDQDTWLKAFPSAEWYAAYTPGWRWGNIIKVTNLNDNGSGSLREALTASGARTVIFDVSGIIEVESPIFIRNPYITLAGQSAPGDGIIIKNSPNNNKSPVYVDTHDVIIRHMRFRPGASTALSQNLDALTLDENAENVIIDHSSFSWSVDENLGGEQSQNITVQWSIFSEGLKNSTHCNSDCSETETHSRGILFGWPNTGFLSIHHNLFVSNQRRNPEITAHEDMPVDIVNNYIYNPQTGIIDINDNDGDTSVNIVWNYYDIGPDTNLALDPYLLDLRVSDKVNKSWSGDFSLYAVWNYDALHRTDASQDEALIMEEADRIFMWDERINTPFVQTTLFAKAKQNVLDWAWAFAQWYDAVDQRIFTEVVNNTGNIPNSPIDIWGWPTIALTYQIDTDNDGIPDSFEDQFPSILNRLDSSDATQDYDSDGYNNFEEYLNILAGDNNSLSQADAFTPPLRPTNIQ